MLDQPSPGKYIAYAVSWDGRLRKLDVATGNEIEPPALFVPPNGKPYGLNLVNGVIYTSTAQGCGGNPNNFYSYDLATKKVGNWAPGSGGLWPRTGPSVGKDGTVYAGSGDGDYVPAQQIYGQAFIGVKQNPQTKALELKDWYAPVDAYWMRKRDLDFNTSSPIFEYKGKEYIVSSSKECRIWLMDTSSLGGEDHRTPAHRTPLICNEEVNFTMGVWGALATWQDAKGTRWVLTPFWGPKHTRFEAPIEHGQVVYGAVAAFKVVDDAKTGKPTLIPAWISRDMYMADPPVIANGVVYAYGSGESTTQRWAEPGHVGGSQGRILESTHAVLYALDGETGDELWSSKDQITSWNHFSGLSIANGRVYIGTFDGMLYCFGAASLPARTSTSAIPAARQAPAAASEGRRGAAMTDRHRAARSCLAVCAATASSLLQRRDAAALNGRPAATTRSGRRRSRPIREFRFQAMQKPGEFGPFKFLWKLKLEYEPKAATALTQPILLDRIIGFRGFKSIAFVGTQSETVHAIDIDLGTPLWKYHINYSASPPPMLNVTN